MAPNANRLLFAGFMAIFAAGVGFAVRGGIFANWATDFGFTGGQLGEIGGFGFTGFCFGIIIGGVLADKIGYGFLIVASFAFHVLSAVVTFMATKGQSQELAFAYLKWGMFIFAYANGTLEAVANPLVATLYPNNRTHYLNILHASWPAGLVAGGAAGWYLGDIWSWKMQLALYLIPTLAYGVLFLGQAMPKSEASQKGLSLGEMFKDVGILGGLVICFLLAIFFKDQLKLPEMVSYGIGGALLAVVALITGFSIGAWLLFALFVAHALVGAVELGTDGWIQNITGNILTPAQGKILFVWTSLVMFGLRFCAHFIENTLKLSPPALLLVCAITAAVGLNLVSTVETFGMAMLALTVYAIGKTFFWPTMLAVASDRFPRTGAIAISIMGGIGMMSAGLIGSPGLGYAKDRFGTEALAKADPQALAEVKAEKESSFLFFEKVPALDGGKLGGMKGKLENARTELTNAKADPKGAYDKLPDPIKAKLKENLKAKLTKEKEELAKSEEKLEEKTKKLADVEAKLANADKDDAVELTARERAVLMADIAGDRKTLVADSFIPAAMAAIYLLLVIYFKAIGGYKQVSIVSEGSSEDKPASA